MMNGTAHSLPTGRPPVAIVGMAVLLPGAAGLQAYWQNVLGGVDAITDVPEGRWDAEHYRPGSASGPAAAHQVYCRRGGFVDDLAEVEVTRFGITPNSVAGTEPDHLIALNVAAAAIADAGGEDRLPDRRRIGVILGRGGYLTPGLVRHDQRVRTAGQLVRTLGELVPDLSPGQLERVRAAFTERLGPYSPEAAIGLASNLAASRIANRLDLRGPAYTVDAACASSLVAVDQAVGELAAGRCDLVLAGGVHHCHDITLWSAFSQTRVLSPSQRIRPFHRHADGILIGEGTGVVVLKRLADAERDDDRVYAVIRGTGVASDGRAAGLVSPDSGGQTRAVRQAWQAAGLDPARPGVIGLLEAHGTATPAGDATELATIAAVFGTGDAGGGDRAVIGSVKSMIGHTMPAAGAAGLIKAALAVHHAMLPPTLHCDDPHPALAATRFRTLDQAIPWETTPEQRVRRAGVNAFGFGGINAHVVLEQAPTARTRSPGSPGSRAPRRERAAAVVAEPEQVLMLAAGGPERLAALLDADDSVVRASGLDTGRTHPDAGPARLGVVAPTAERLALARRAVARGGAWHGRGDVWFRPDPLLVAGDGKLAFVFPGLEADFTPRVDDVATHFGLSAVPGPLARSGERGRVFDVLRHGFGVFGVGRLLDAALRRMAVVPDAVAGHSIGEWTAMTTAGMCSGDDVNDFVASFTSGTTTLPDLAFAAIGAPVERVLTALDGGWADAGLVLSHDNAPSQSIVCGPGAAVEEFVGSFRAQGVLSQVLPFRSGFHTPMLEPCLASLTQGAHRFPLRPPAVPVWSATTAEPYPEGEAAVRELFVRHLLEPVRFRQLVEAMYAAGHRAFVQVGPGQLGSLIGETLSGRDHLVVAANSPHRPGLAQLRRLATALWSAGAAVAPALPPSTGSAGPGQAAGPGRAGRPPVRLDLSGALVSLAGPALDGLRAELASGRAPAAARSGGHLPAPGAATSGPAPTTAPAPAAAAATAGRPATERIASPYGAPAMTGTPSQGAAAAADAGSTPLDALAGRFPAAAELSALLRSTEDIATALIVAAGRHPAPAAAPAPVSAPPAGAPRAEPGSSASPTTRQARPAGDLVATARPGHRREWHTVVRVSPETMPYLLDHCFFPQRPGWPDVADRGPVVPATTIVHHIMGAAQRAAPGMRAVAVHGARFDAWLTAAPPVDVPVTVTEVADRPDRLAVSYGPHARAVVELATRYPPPPPYRRLTDPAGERAPDHTAAQLYSERWMFHGPAFQGVTELTAIGDTHVRGVITTLPAPGALLDNVGQILGYWIMATHSERTMVFPVQLRHTRFYGPHPRPRTQVECQVRITSLTDTMLEADVRLAVEGRVWAELTGWQDRRFDNAPQTRAAERFPERNTLSLPRPGGWSLLHERWPDLASRELYMRNSCSAVERSEYAQRPLRGRRQWLLGRIAAKDAVRQWLWDHGEGPVFPAEIRVRNDAAGRPYVTGLHGRTLPPLDLSLAHRAEAGVAIVRPHTPGPGPGIDIEEVAERDARTLAAALGEDELRLLRHRCAATGEREALWFTRFWAAKEAVAKAEGTGFRGRPRDFTVLQAASGDRLMVTGRLGHTYTVRCEPARNPPGLPSRDYIVAWTTGPTHEGSTTDDPIRQATGAA
ncbi:beta-ketoacyl synthase N-terminal-like domain-containing protein [Streptomyces sp. NPDC052020]|uniref:type I polyketide synthase n=1 Tax=Streptomyces sp. NPDC052020 TaxID=3155677 RepID=UPI003425F038